MNKLYKIIIPSLLTISLLSCSQSIENAQVFIATNDLQIGSNRFTFAVADKNGLVNSESIEVSFNGDGGYPKIIKSFNFVQFPDYYNTELGNGIYTQIIEFEKSGTWKLKVGDGEGLVDIRSKSRQGASDLGQNAKRIERLKASILSKVN